MQDILLGTFFLLNDNVPGELKCGMKCWIKRFATSDAKQAEALEASGGEGVVGETIT